MEEDKTKPAEPAAVPPEEAAKPDEATADKPAESKAVVSGSGKKSLKKPLLIALAAIVLLAGGAFAYMSMSDKDDPVPSATTEETTAPAETETSDSLPAGYVLFADEGTKVSFAYPESWGVATLSQGEEERMKHLTAGSQKIVTFSVNKTVVAGFMSTDWTHDPDMGHGGVGEPGVKSLDDAKKVKENIKASNVLVDNDTDFAYVTYCADNCSDTPKYQVHYSFVISGNTDYSAIQFYQDGDAIGSEYMTDGLVDYEELDDVDLSILFPATDPRFVELQKISAYAQTL